MLGRSKEEFVGHYKQKYGLPLPIWVSVELWEFGMLSTFYQGMTVNDKSVIAIKHGVPDWRVMESWLRALNFVRNVAAHHSRLWNKNLVDQPKMPFKGDITAFDPIIGIPSIGARLYAVICILMHFMQKLSPNSSWQKRIKVLLDGFPVMDNLCLADMGFPHDWQSHDFWRH